MEALNIDWNNMVNNTKFDPIPTTPKGVFSQESIDKAIDSLGKIAGVYTRKEMLSKDPQLERMYEKLKSLEAQRTKKVEQLRQIQESVEYQAESAYESAKNLKMPDEKASAEMDGYTTTPMVSTPSYKYGMDGRYIFS